jgi:hypothetical protein
VCPAEETQRAAGKTVLPNPRARSTRYAPPTRIGQLASNLLGLGWPIRIANMTGYPGSGESEVTTGRVLSVDGGVTIY